MALTFSGINKTIIPIGTENILITGSEFSFGNVTGYTTYNEALWHGGSTDYDPQLNLAPTIPMAYSPSSTPFSNDLIIPSDKYSPSSRTSASNGYGYGFGRSGNPDGAVSLCFGYKTLPTSRETLVESVNSALDKANISYDPVTDSVKLIYGPNVLEITNAGIVAGEWYRVCYWGVTGANPTYPKGIRLSFTPSNVDAVTNTQTVYDPYWGTVEFEGYPPVYGRGTEGPAESDGYNYFSGYMCNYYQSVVGVDTIHMTRYVPRTRPKLVEIGPGTITDLVDSVTYLSDDSLLFTMPTMPLGNYRISLYGTDLNGSNLATTNYIEIEITEALPAPTPDPGEAGNPEVTPIYTKDYLDTDAIINQAEPINTAFDKAAKIINKEILTKVDIVDSDNQMEVDINVNSKSTNNVGDPVESSDLLTVKYLQRFLENRIVVDREQQLGSDVSAGESILLSLTYTVGSNDLSIYKNGLRMYSGRDFVESAVDRVLWITSVNPTDVLEFYVTSLN